MWNNIISYLQIPHHLEFLHNVAMLNVVACLLIIVVLSIIFQNKNIVLVLLSSVVSVLLSLIYIFMDSPDVALTESAINCCLSTYIALRAIRYFKNDVDLREDNWDFTKIYALAISILSAGCFLYISTDLPEFGSPSAVIHHQVSKFYIDNTINDIGIEAVITAILASYRGFDTMGETIVIASAALGVVYLNQRQDV